MLIGERAARVSCPYQLIQGASWQGDMGSACTAREGTWGQGERQRRYIKILDTGGVIILLLQK